MTGETQRAYLAQTLLGLFIGVAIVAGDFAVDPDVGVRFLGKEEAAAVSVLAELQRVFGGFPHRAGGLTVAEALIAAVILRPSTCTAEAWLNSA